MRRLTFCLALLWFGLVPQVAVAQCANATQLSCAVYDRCFTRYCSCTGDASEYFRSYGRKYCDRFLASSGWSAAGQQWRDKTLLCLQERIVPKLDISDRPSCDCKAMKSFAYRTHVDCYTQTSASICNLTYADFKKIFDIIDVRDDLFGDPYGRAQMRDVLEICRRDQNSTIPHTILDLIAAIIEKLS